MKTLSHVCEGILDITADNYDIGLYHKGYRVVSVADHGGWSLLAPIKSFDKTLFWNGVLKKELGKYRDIEYSSNEFVKLTAFNGRGYSFFDADKRSKALPINYLFAFIYVILYCSDWYQLLRDNLPNEFDITVDDYSNEMIISIKKGNKYVTIDIKQK